MISIITITYNAAETLPATMQSVRRQHCAAFEHLIIDGASKDSTLEIARAMGTPGLRIISEPDRGLYDAMNKGLANARGKYVIFLNAGDRFATAGTLARYMMATAHNPDIVYGDTVVVDEDDNILRSRHLSAPRVLTVDSFKKGMLVCHQAFMVRKEIAPLYDLSYRFSADYDWCIRCIKAASPQRCENLRCVTIHYLDGGTTVKNRFPSLRERFRIMVRHYGCLSTVIRHVGFVMRALMRRSAD